MKTPTSVRKLIKSRQAYLGISNEDMACQMHMSLSSWNRRMRTPDRITVAELCKLEKILKLNLLEV